MVSNLESGRWYLFTIRKMAKREGTKPAVDVTFECAKGEAAGQRVAEPFWLSERSISRFEVLAHRTGVEVDIKSPNAVDVKVFAQMLGKNVWFPVRKAENFGGALCSDGWNFRAENDPPEEEKFVDYSLEDERDRVFSGL